MTGLNRCLLMLLYRELNDKISSYFIDTIKTSESTSIRACLEVTPVLISKLQELSCDAEGVWSRQQLYEIMMQRVSETLAKLAALSRN